MGWTVGRGGSEGRELGIDPSPSQVALLVDLAGDR
jgi:hypothetical protein